MKTLSDKVTGVELGDRADEVLTNHSVRTLAWQKLNVTASKRGSDSLNILRDVDGLVEAGSSNPN